MVRTKCQKPFNGQKVGRRTLKKTIIAAIVEITHSKLEIELPEVRKENAFVMRKRTVFPPYGASSRDF